MERALQKYFSRHGEAEKLPGLENFSRAVVIPAWNELAELPLVLDSLAEAKNSASAAKIVVVNFPKGADSSESVATLDYLKKRRETDGTLFTLYFPDNPDGVGGARKRGMDSFLGACADKNLDDHILFSLDADTLVSADYFTAVEAAFSSDPTLGGASLPFRHRVTEQIFAEALARYEEYLHHYVAKLAEAGSPYAVHAIGSALAVRLSAYLRADGMRLRHAGEDFYFIMDLVKTGKFRDLDGEALVFPAGRGSERTPFGTGAALRKIASGEGLNEISDRAFAELKKVLEVVEKSAMSIPAAEFLAALPHDVAAFLIQEKFPENWAKISANTPRTRQAQIAAFHRWFDALRTLRCLHSIDCKN